MGLFVRRSFPRPLLRSGTPLSDPKIRSVFGMESMSDLPSMNPMKATGIPAVLTCLDVKSKDIAMLPRHLYKRVARGREKVTDHDQLYLIKTAPNDIQSAFDFWRVMHMNKYLWGNAYALKETARNGRPAAWRLMKPNEVDPFFDKTTQSLTYIDLVSGTAYAAEDVIHLRDISFDGIKGYSRITLARIAFQKGWSLDEFGAHFYHNKTNLSGWIEYPDWFDDDSQQDQLLNVWRQKYRGYGKSDVAVLAGGTKYHSITMPMTDAQFMENQKFSLQQIAMIYNIPLTRLGMLEDANRSNMEATMREYATFSLQSEVIQLEQELTRKTLRPSEQASTFWKVELKGLLRGDTQAQSEWIKTMIDRGIMTPNEIREIEDMNPLDYGDRAYMPLNMIPTDKVDAYIDAITLKKDNKTKSLLRALLSLPIDPSNPLNMRTHATGNHSDGEASELSEVFSTNGHPKEN